MRRIVPLLVACGALGVLAWLAVRDETSETARPAGTVSLVGDSLNVGIEPYLPDALPGWTIRNDNREGRLTAEGVDVLRALGRELAPWVVVSLGTNDQPDDVAGFRSRVRRAVALAGARRCVIWVGIYRTGEPYDDLNAVLRDEAAANDNVRILDWRALVLRNPGWLSVDGVHATPEGYAQRARAVADAVRSCSPRPAPTRIGS
jgi:lysophospholipase L1-like esterase